MMDLSQLSDAQLAQAIAQHEAGQAIPPPVAFTPPSSNQAIQSQPQNYGGIESFFRGAPSGFFGVGPKVSAGIATAMALAHPELFQGQSVSDIYKQAYNTVKQQQSDAQKQHPWAFAGGQLAAMPAVAAAAKPFGLGMSSSVKDLAGIGGLFGLGSSDYGSATQVAKDVATNAATNVLLGKALSGLGSSLMEGYSGAPSSMIAPSIAAGGIGGGAYGAYNADWEDPWEAIKTVGSDAAKGAGILGGLSTAAYLGGKGVSAAQPYIESGINAIKNYLGFATPNANEAANEITPDQQARINVANRFGLNISKGQATQDPEALAQEEQMAQGKFGPSNAESIRDLREGQTQQFKDIGAGLRNKLGEGEFTENGNAINPAVNKVQELAAQEKQAVNKAYENVGNAILDPNEFHPFKQQIEGALQEKGIYPVNGGAAYNETEALQQILKKNPDGVNFKEIEGWRQGLNDAISGAEGRDKSGLIMLKKQFDTYLDNTFDHALLNGDSATLENIKAARELNAKWMSKFTAKDSTEAGKSFIEDIVDNASSREPYTNQQIVNKMFGTSELGFKPQSVNIVNELKNQLGEDSPEFQGIKMEAVNRVLKPVLKDTGDINIGNPAIQTYKNNLAKNMPVLKEIFNGDQIDELKAYGDLGSTLFQLKRSGYNPSQSGTYLQQLMSSGNHTGLLSYVLQGVDYVKNKNLASDFIKENPTELGEALKSLNKIKAIQDAGGGIVPQALKYISDKSGVTNVSSALAASGTASIDNNKVIPQKQIKGPIAAPPPVQYNYQGLSDKDLNDLIAKEEAKQGVNQAPSNETQGINQAIQNYQKQTGNIMVPNTWNPNSQAVSNNLIKKIAQVESGGNPNAHSSNSTASGLFQFTNGTWRDAVNKYGAQNGITMADKNNPQAQYVMASNMLANNENQLTSYLGRTPTDAELYMTHFLGLDGAKKMLSTSPNEVAAKLFPKEARANRNLFFKSGRAITVGELYHELDRKLSV